MNCKIIIERKALKFISRQPQTQKVRILTAINKLPDEGDRKELKGIKGVFRLRVGSYRIIYEVDQGQLIVRVVDAGNRGDIYKGY